MGPDGARGDPVHQRESSASPVRPRDPQYSSLLQECWYFPLRTQFQQLLQLEEYRHLLMFEDRRQSNDRFVTDVYDAPRWREVMGATSGKLDRIAVQLCVDGVESFNNGSVAESVKPLQYCVLSFPPHLRYKTEYMLLQMLIPASLKGQAAKKYYDWAANYEMNDLHGTLTVTDCLLRGHEVTLSHIPLVDNGVEGVRVLLYGTTLDSPGRRELLQMQV